MSFNAVHRERTSGVNSNNSRTTSRSFARFIVRKRSRYAPFFVLRRHGRKFARNLPRLKIKRYTQLSRGKKISPYFYRISPRTITSHMLNMFCARGGEKRVDALVRFCSSLARKDETKAIGSRVCAWVKETRQRQRTEEREAAVSV